MQSINQKQGLDYLQTGSFLDYIIIANDVQLRAMKIMLEREFQKRGLR